MTPYYADDRVSIFHGDCLEVLPSLPVDEIAAVISDPPYGMDLDTDMTRFSGGSKGHRANGQGRDYGAGIHGDDRPFDPTPWLDFPRVVLWGFHHFAERLPVGTALVWLKRLDGAFGNFLSDAELAWVKGGCGVYCRRDLTLNAKTANRLHPTEKPEGLMGWCIDRAKVPQGGLILDPYMGSGTTLRAAKDRGFRAIGCEIEERYCEVAAKRMRQECLFAGVG